jgi:hypothetical protein
MFISKFRETLVLVFTSFGSIEEAEGINKKSSKVYPSGAFFNFSENILLF